MHDWAEKCSPIYYIQHSQTMNKIQYAEIDDEIIHLYDKVMYSGISSHVLLIHLASREICQF